MSPFLDLEDPVVNASGTFDAIAARRAFGDALLERFPFAAFVTKTVTIAPRQGNPAPRLYELPERPAELDRAPEQGLGRLPAARTCRSSPQLPVPLIVNVMGGAHDEVAELVERVGERDEVTALELNVSCPNVKTGLMFGADPNEVAAPAGRGSSPDDQAADRQADAQLRLAGRRRGRRRGARRRRRVADQHAAGDGASPTPARRAVARRKDGWSFWPSRPRGRNCPSF